MSVYLGMYQRAWRGIGRPWESRPWKSTRERSSGRGSHVLPSEKTVAVIPPQFLWLNSESIWNKQAGLGFSVWPPMWCVTESPVAKGWECCRAWRRWTGSSAVLCAKGLLHCPGNSLWGKLAWSVGVSGKRQISRCDGTSVKGSQEVEVEETFRQLEEA